MAKSTYVIDRGIVPKNAMLTLLFKNNFVSVKKYKK
jgi:hypothetical protein